MCCFSTVECQADVNHQGATQGVSIHSYRSQGSFVLKILFAVYTT